jgi:hypothetical protein
VLLRHINLAAPSIFSISIFMAGLTVIPFVMGPLDIIFAVVSLFVRIAVGVEQQHRPL